MDPTFIPLPAVAQQLVRTRRRPRLSPILAAARREGENPTLEFIANTSLGSPYHPPEESEETPAQRRQAELRRQQRAVLRGAVEQHNAARREHLEIEAEQRDWNDRTNAAFDAWNEHVWTFSGIQQDYESALARFIHQSSHADPGSEAARVLMEFSTHMKNAINLSLSSLARRFAVLRWFCVGLPYDLINATDDTATYYETETNLRYEWHMVEMEGRSHEDWCRDPNADICLNRATVFAATIGERFGWGDEKKAHGFTRLRYKIQDENDLQVLEANIQIRRIRLEHAEPSERFGFAGESQEELDASLDGRIILFIVNALKRLNCSTSQDVLTLWKKLPSFTET